MSDCIGDARQRLSLRRAHREARRIAIITDLESLWHSFAVMVLAAVKAFDLGVEAQQDQNVITVAGRNGGNRIPSLVITLEQEKQLVTYVYDHVPNVQSPGMITFDLDSRITKLCFVFEDHAIEGSELVRRLLEPLFNVTY